MSRIKLLDDRLISQIAAGEVVERPASVLKELVENALDAGAGEVVVELEAGGKRRIVVSDDGSGMGADDTLLAFDRHATSKIASFDDLERVASLGFRGEALSSIAAVSRVELRSAEQPGDGHRVRIEGGRVHAGEPVAHPRGTRIEVASLFWNVPARRKFLKQPKTELRHALAVVQGYALARPEVRFSVRHEGRSLLETTPASDDVDGLGERIGQIFGRPFRDQLTEILPGPQAAGEAIEGFVGDPSTAAGRRQYVFVNRRLVRDRAVLAVYYRAVREVLKGDRPPALFLFLALDPAEVDVNVHPQKAEVRFRDPGFVGRVAAALRLTLEATRGEVPAPLSPPRAAPGMPAWEGLGGRGGEDGWQIAGEVREAPDAGGGYGSTVAPPGRGEPSRGEPSPGEPSPGEPQPRPAGAGWTQDEASSRGLAQPTFAATQPRMVPLSGRGGPPRRLRILGQYKASLILLEGAEGLYLIDQHVAHERLLFERMRRAFSQRQASSQRLIQPLLLELGPAEALALEELAPALGPMGFELQVLSGGTAAVNALPEGLAIEQGVQMIERLATTGSDGADDPEALAERLIDALAADASCKAAIKMHRPMTMDEMEALVSELFRAEQPYSCPHGRPVVLEMTDAELERRFGRR